MDTDSIYADKKIFNDSHELGKMKLENEVRGMLFFAPKFYFYHGGIKCKGVKVYDTDEDGNKKMNYDRVMDYAMGKKISYSGGLKKIRSSIPAEVFLSENEITRSYKHFYDKREIRGLDTFPIERMPFDNSRQYRAILSEMQGILQKNRDLYFQSNS
jgi:hypothetical protein